MKPDLRGPRCRFAFKLTTIFGLAGFDKATLLRADPRDRYRCKPEAKSQTDVPPNQTNKREGSKTAGYVMSDTVETNSDVLL